MNEPWEIHENPATPAARRCRREEASSCRRGGVRSPGKTRSVANACKVWTALVDWSFVGGAVVLILAGWGCALGAGASFMLGLGTHALVGAALVTFMWTFAGVCLWSAVEPLIHGRPFRSPLDCGRADD